MRGKEATDWLRFQSDHAERLQAEGRTLRHYWGSGSGSEALVFNGKPEVEQLARGEQPIHLAPFINHSDEGTPEHNVQGVHIRVSNCCCIKSLLISHLDAGLTFWPFTKGVLGVYNHQESGEGPISSGMLRTKE